MKELNHAQAARRARNRAANLCGCGRARLPDHRMCTGCLDTGWARMYLGGGLNDYTEVPCGCTQSVTATAA